MSSSPVSKDYSLWYSMRMKVSRRSRRDWSWKKKNSAIGKDKGFYGKVETEAKMAAELKSKEDTKKQVALDTKAKQT
jgi:hypothetical protein